MRAPSLRCVARNETFNACGWPRLQWLWIFAVRFDALGRAAFFRGFISYKHLRLERVVIRLLEVAAEDVGQFVLQIAPGLGLTDAHHAGPDTIGPQFL